MRLHRVRRNLATKPPLQCRGHRFDPWSGELTYHKTQYSKKKKREREKKDGAMERDFLFMGVRLKTTKDERVLFYLV